VFDAVSAQDDALAGAIRGSDNTFDALASEDDALAETFKIMPTFQRETRATLERLDQFQANTKPLIDNLIPVARDLSPTLASVRELSPNLRDLFVKLGDIETVAKTGLPAAKSFLDGLRPVLDQLDPFLANLNPVIRYLQFQEATVVDFLMAPGVALSGKYVGEPGDPAARHGLRQIGYVSQEALSIYPQRLATNRGNGYLAPGALNSFSSAKNGIFPNFDCRNTDYGPGSTPPDEDQILPGQSVPGVNNGEPPAEGFAPCYTQGDFPGPPGDDFGSGRFPGLFQDP
jgi:phospholipid/cholesterol/gamma-HCH transport system substrate-binding protein